MTCPFCHKTDDQYGSLELHYQRHEIEALNRIAGAIENLIDHLDQKER